MHVGAFGSPTAHFDLSNIGTGTLSPANAAGTASGVTMIYGNYTQASPANMQIDLGGTQPGTGYDQVTVSNTANLGGTFTVHVINGFQATLNEQFTPLQFSGHVANFPRTLA